MTLEVDGGAGTCEGHEGVNEAPSKPQHRKNSSKVSVSTSPSAMKDFIKQKFRQVASTTRKSAISSGNDTNSNSGSATTSSTSLSTTVGPSASAMIRGDPFLPQPLDASSRDFSFDDLTKLNPPSMESNADNNSNDGGAVTAGQQHHKTTIDMKQSPNPNMNHSVFSRDSRSMSLSQVPRLPPLSPPSCPNSPALRRSKSVSNPVVAGRVLREALPHRSLDFSALEASERSTDDVDDLSLLDNKFPVTSPAPGALDESRSDLLTVVDDEVLLPVDAPFVQLHITDESGAVVLSPRNLLPERFKKKKEKDRQSKESPGKSRDGENVNYSEEGQEQHDNADAADGDGEKQRSPKPPRSPRRTSSTNKPLSTPKSRSKHSAHPYSPPSPPSSESPTKPAKDKKSPKTPTSRQSSRKKSSGGGGSKHRRSTLPNLSPLGTPSSSKVGKKQSVDANIAELVELISPESSQKRSTYLQQFQHHADEMRAVEGATGQESTEPPPELLSQQHLPDLTAFPDQDQEPR